MSIAAQSAKKNRKSLTLLPSLPKFSEKLRKYSLFSTAIFLTPLLIMADSLHFLSIQNRFRVDKDPNNSLFLVKLVFSGNDFSRVYKEEVAQLALKNLLSGKLAHFTQEKVHGGRLKRSVPCKVAKNSKPEKH